MTDLVPLVFAKVHGGCTSLDTSTVDENVNLAAHDVQCTLEDRFDVVHVGEVCVDDLGSRQLCHDWEGGVCRLGTDDETDVCACLCQGDGTCCAYTCRRCKKCDSDR